MKRVCWTALPVLLAIAPASNAQSVGYEEALRAATSDQPQVRTSELRLDARREIADASSGSATTSPARRSPTIDSKNAPMEPLRCA